MLQQLQWMLVWNKAKQWLLWRYIWKFLKQSLEFSVYRDDVTKQCNVRFQDGPGFYTTRILAPTMAEVIALLQVNCQEQDRFLLIVTPV